MIAFGLNQSIIEVINKEMSIGFFLENYGNQVVREVLKLERCKDLQILADTLYWFSKIYNPKHPVILYLVYKIKSACVDGDTPSVYHIQNVLQRMIEIPDTVYEGSNISETKGA